MTNATLADALDSIDTKDWGPYRTEILHALRAEGVPQDAKDAARYRFLRNTPPWKNEVSAIMHTGVADDIAILTHEGLDIAIDRQMRRDNSESGA